MDIIVSVSDEFELPDLHKGLSIKRKNHPNDMLWGKANKHMKNDNLFMALNSGIMHNYNVDKTIKHI